MKRGWMITGMLCILFWMLAGCSITNMKEEAREAMEYTIVPEKDVPSELLNLIEDKKENSFQMTYQDKNYLYLVRGYGQQEMGGYSIQVEELSRGSESMLLRTELIGPPKEENQSLEPSYPYIVIKVEYREMPVQFE